jgi:hypothetical protein
LLARRATRSSSAGRTLDDIRAVCIVRTMNASVALVSAPWSREQGGEPAGLRQSFLPLLTTLQTDLAAGRRIDGCCR